MMSIVQTAVVTGCLAFALSVQAALSPETQKLAAANAGFSFKLLREITKAQPGDYKPGNSYRDEHRMFDTVKNVVGGFGLRERRYARTCHFLGQVYAVPYFRYEETKTFAEFYPYYLAEHRNGICRILHFIGSNLVIGTAGLMLWTQNWWLALLLPVIGYGFAWVGHFFFEKNRPATFKYPFYSFAGDWVMYKDILTGKIPF